MVYNWGILLGQIIKISGYEGAVTVKLERSFSGKIPDIGPVFLEIEGRPVPFFISESVYPGADILKLKFEGYDSAEKVAGLTGCRIFLTTRGRQRKATENISDLVGYKILTPDGTPVGTAEEVIANPGQSLLRAVSGSGREILIPLHDNLIVRIDSGKKQVIMDLPDGLTEIN